MSLGELGPVPNSMADPPVGPGAMLLENRTLPSMMPLVCPLLWPEFRPLRPFLHVCWKQRARGLRSLSLPVENHPFQSLPGVLAVRRADRRALSKWLASPPFPQFEMGLAI